MPLSLIEQRQVFSLCLAELILWAVYEKNWRVAINEVKREKEQQKYFISIGKSKTMKSKHLDGRAADLLLWIGGVLQTETEQYKEMGLKWEELGYKKGVKLIWGGRFGDKPETEKIEGWDGCHFEISS